MKSNPASPPVRQDFPRLLFLTNEPPQTSGAGSIIFHRLFRDYPPDRLLVVSNRSLAPADQLLACKYIRLPLRADRLNRTRFWKWRAALRALGASRFTSLRRIDRSLGDFKPDGVIALMQDSWYYDLAARYARARHLPLVLFGHDLPHGFEPVAPWLRPWQRRRDIAVCRQAAACLCVSQGMVDYFRAEFDVRAEVLLPPRSDQTPAQAPEVCATLKHPGRLTLGYAGGLHYGYGEQLLRMLPVLRATGTRVEVFGPLPSGNLAALDQAGDVIHFHGYVSPPEAAWSALLGICDAVLQPYANPPGAQALQYRTHFPSKLGDCLSLGLPLLITGPAYASGVDWCARHPGCALIVDQAELDALAAALLRLRDDAALRVAFARHAQAVAGIFDAPALREQLYAVLRRPGSARPWPD